MVFMVLAGFVVALVVSRYLGEEERVGDGLSRSRFSKIL
jgi:hypothetical protein